GEELAAVMLPYFLSNTGLSEAACSSVMSPRKTPSLVTVSSYLGGTCTCMTSASYLPAAQAAAAFLCERRANSSCAAREMPFSLAIFSADSPIVRPVDGSASAGGTGTRSRG